MFGESSLGRTFSKETSHTQETLEASRKRITALQEKIRFFEEQALVAASSNVPRKQPTSPKLRRSTIDAKNPRLHRRNSNPRLSPHFRRASLPINKVTNEQQNQEEPQFKSESDKQHQSELEDSQNQLESSTPVQTQENYENDEVTQNEETIENNKEQEKENHISLHRRTQSLSDSIDLNDSQKNEPISTGTTADTKQKKLKKLKTESEPKFEISESFEKLYQILSENGKFQLIPLEIERLTW